VGACDRLAPGGHVTGVYGILPPIQTKLESNLIALCDGINSPGLKGKGPQATQIDTASL
jgi:hypothetical protein